MELAKVMKKVYKYRKTAYFFSKSSNYSIICNYHLQYLGIYL